MMMESELHLHVENRSGLELFATYKETFSNGRRHLLVILERARDPHQHLSMTAAEDKP